MKMNNDNNFPKRKRNRLKDYDYASSGAYFITVCTKDRKNIFWEKDQPDFLGEDIVLPPDKVRLSPYGKIAKEAINTIPDCYPHIELLEYVIMPNHIHMIIFVPYDSELIASPRKNILTVVGQMKRYVSKKTNRSIWQKSFHDHIIRDKNDYEKISQYVYENPIKWQYDCFYTEEFM